MDALVLIGYYLSLRPPVRISAASDRARCLLEFVTANIRNPHTRKAYSKAAGDFAIWCEHPSHSPPYSYAATALLGRN